MKKYVDEETLNSFINQLEEVKNKMTSIENCYPIGSIYISTSSISPAQIFNFGSWIQIKDKFLLSSGDNYALGSSGGESTHKLTMNEIPKHKFKVRTSSTVDVSTEGVYAFKDYMIDKDHSHAQYRDVAAIESLGGDEAHNNMPPYLTVSIWERIS